MAGPEAGQDEMGDRLSLSLPKLSPQLPRDGARRYLRFSTGT